MRKNGSRLISLTQYRLSDVFMFALILGLSELLSFCAAEYWFTSSALFSLSFLTPVVMLVMIRWGWISVFFAAADGALYCVLRGYGWQNYLVYGIGNCLSALMLIVFVFVKKDKITSKWYYSLLFLTGGWALINFGRAAVTAAFGNNFLSALGAVCGIGDNGVLSLVIGLILVLILRRLDGMWEDQKSYLIRKDEERREQAKRDEFGDEPVEIDEETVSILKRWDDGLGK